MCQPGRPGPQGLSQDGSSGLAAFQRAKSRTSSLAYSSALTRSLAPALSSRRSSWLSRPWLTQLVQQAAQLIDHALELGELDFVREVAFPLPMHMIADIVGIPEADRDWLFATANAFLTAGDPRSGLTKEAALLHQIRLFEYAQELSRAKRERSIFQAAARFLC